MLLNNPEEYKNIPTSHVTKSNIMHEGVPEATLRVSKGCSCGYGYG